MENRLCFVAALIAWMYSIKIRNILLRVLPGKQTMPVFLVKELVVVVNEFGQVGIDGAIFTAQGAIAREVPGGCLCCAAGLTFQVAVNRLLTEVKPDQFI